MAGNKDLKADSGKFAEVLEAKIEAKEHPFEIEHPFLRIACRGLANRLGQGQIVPSGFVLATAIYMYDIETGRNGFTGEPMPGELTEAPAILKTILEMTVEDLGHEAFGDEFMQEAAASQR